jgi:hypothetical protein
MKNNQLKKFPRARPKWNRHVPVFSWEKDVCFYRGTIKWTLIYGTNNEDELVIGFASNLSFLQKCNISVQKQARKDIALCLCQAKKRLKSEWRKRNPSHA